MISEKVLNQCKDKCYDDFLKFKDFLNSKNIDVQEDKPYWNILFKKKNKTFLIAQAIIYRASGQCVVFSPSKDKKTDDFIYLENSLFYSILAGTIINYFEN